MRIASVSKLVTALALAPLLESGQVSLQQDLSELLGQPIRHPDLPHEPIRLSHLLSHTSLLADSARYSVPLQQPLLPLLRDSGRWLSAQQYRPGTCFNYCNLNYGLLACVMERITGVRFDQYLKQVLLEPLGIPGGFNVAAFSQAEIEQLAPVHQWQAGAWVPQIDLWQGRVPRLEELPSENPDVGLTATATADGPWLGESYVLGSNGSAFSPQGGLRTSLEGLAALALGILDDARISRHAALLDQPSWQAENGQKEDDCDGLFSLATLGSHRVALPDDDYLWGHAGAAYGLLSGLYLHRQSRSALVWLIGGTNPQDPYLANTRPHKGFSQWEASLLKLFIEQL
ncbi:conserved hypothetical protein [Pseudomonas sp. 8AS]|nr:conserved hypothetical protein [Pseudomonas sp. 8AS]